MVRNLGCFRLWFDAVIMKVTSGVLIFDKCEETPYDLRGVVALLVTEGKCLLGLSCHPECTGGSFFCLQDPLLCGCSTAICGREGLCLICSVSSQGG